MRAKIFLCFAICVPFLLHGRQPIKQKAPDAAYASSTGDSLFLILLVVTGRVKRITQCVTDKVNRNHNQNQHQSGRNP